MVVAFNKHTGIGLAQGPSYNHAMLWTMW